MKEIRRIDLVAYVTVVVTTMFYFLDNLLLPIINGTPVNASTQGWKACIVGLLIGAGCYIASKNRRLEIAYIIYVVVAALLLIFGDKTYSLIDEAAHFDYINYIVKNHCLPTLNDYVDVYTLNSLNGSHNVMMRNYEAVQGPVYYFLMAIVFGWIDDLWTRFICIRVVGLVFLLASLGIGCKAIDVLKKGGVVQSEQNVLFFLNIFLLNPGTVIRCTRVSNESLAILLSCIVAYLYVQLLVGEYDRKKVFFATFLGATLFLTKSTNVYWLGGVFFVLIYYKKWKDILYNMVLLAVVVGPWFANNILLYGKLTGMEGHMEIVMPILNPNYEKVEIWSRLSHLFGKSLFLPNENIFGNGLADYCYGIINSYFNVVLIVVLILTVHSFILVFGNKLVFNYSTLEKRRMLLLLFAVETFAFVIILLTGTVKTRIDTIIGRYMYTIALPLSVIFATSYERINTNLLKRVLNFHFIVAFGMAWVLSLNSFGISISENNKIKYSNPSGIEGILGVVDKNTVYEQVFKADFSEIESASIMFGTCGRINNCNLNLLVYEYDTQKLVGESTMSCDTFSDCAFSDIPITMHEKVKKDTMYTIVIKCPDANEQNSIVLFKSMEAKDKKDMDENYSIINGEKQLFDIVLQIKGK